MDYVHSGWDTVWKFKAFIDFKEFKWVVSQELFIYIQESIHEGKIELKKLL